MPPKRRLRSWWGHEQRSVAAALATVTHHSSQVGTKNHAQRGQKTVTSAGGWRPGAAAIGYVAAGALLLVVPSLRGDDVVDGTSAEISQYQLTVFPPSAEHSQQTIERVVP